MEKTTTPRPDCHDAHHRARRLVGQHGEIRPDRTTGAIRTPIFTSNSYRLPRDPDDDDSTDPDFLIYGREAAQPSRTPGEARALRARRGRGGLRKRHGCGPCNVLHAPESGRPRHRVQRPLHGTWDLFNSLLPKKNGIEVDFVDITDLDAVRKAVRPDTALIHTEAITNPPSRSRTSQVWRRPPTIPGRCSPWIRPSPLAKPPEVATPLRASALERVGRRRTRGGRREGVVGHGRRRRGARGAGRP